MEIISYSKIVNELKQACTLEPDCAAVVFDSSTGELVAWSGHKSNQEAVALSNSCTSTILATISQMPRFKASVSPTSLM